MSKPIEVMVVVVVIVVIVFVKRIGPKIFDPKEIPCPKNLRPNIVGSKKKIWARKQLCPKNCQKKMMSQKLRFKTI